MPGNRKNFSRRGGEFADNHPRGRAKFVHAIRIGLRDPQAGIDPCLIVLHGRNVTSQCGVRRKYAEEGAYQEKENPPDFPAMCRNTPPNLDYLNLELSPGVEVASGKRGI